MPERIATGVGPGGIDIAYEKLGSADDPPIVLVTGAGAQLIDWPDGFCRELTTRHVQVVRFDNRDAGRSTHVIDAPTLDFPAVLTGDLSSVHYDLSDMAADTVGLLDAVGIDSAHMVGSSLGGMIAQVVAIEHPHRLRSLTSMMATTGAADVGMSDLGGLGGFGPPPSARTDFIAWRVATLRAVASPGFPFDVTDVATRAALAYDRGFDFEAMQRQCAAAVATGDRTERLRSLTAPTLVVHGAQDAVCDVSGGIATASAIPGAELTIIDGMGHSLPRDVWSDVAARIVALVRCAERRVRTS